MKDIKIFQLAERYHELYPKNDMLAIQRNGKIRTYSTEEYIQTTNNIAYGLINLGMRKNDTMCIISSNRPEWSLVDMGINKIGAINAPIYPNITREEYKYIINDCGARIIFVGSEEIYERLHGLETEIESLEYIFSFDEIKDVQNWMEVVENGTINPQEKKLKELQKSIKQKDLFTLIYT